MAEAIVRLDRGFHGGYVAGTIARLTNITKTSPIPADWLSQSSPYSGPHTPTVVVDCAEAVAASRAHEPVAAAPDRRLTSEQLGKRLPWTRDPQTLDLATSQFGFPRSIPQRTTNLLRLEIISHEYSEGAIDRWLVAKREQYAQLDVFLR